MTYRKISDMYCKYCGKEIADDSKFCKYCGKVVEEVECEFVETLTETSEDGMEPQKVEVVLSTNDDQPVQVEISRKAVIKKTTFANEIVANLKMIGLSILLWILYLIGFSVYRMGDISTTSFYGASRYDSPISGYWKMEWELHYAEAMDRLDCMEKYKNDPIMLLDIYKVRRDFSMYDREVCKRQGDAIAKKLKLSDSRIEQIEADAKASAEKERQRFYEEVYSRRQYAFENEREEHMKWSAIILLSLTIVGRYIIKFFKWVFENVDDGK